MIILMLFAHPLVIFRFYPVVIWWCTLFFARKKFYKLTLNLVEIDCAITLFEINHKFCQLLIKLLDAGFE